MVLPPFILDGVDNGSYSVNQWATVNYAVGITCYLFVDR